VYPQELSLVIRTGVDKKVTGMFKDEACGKQIAEIIALRPKLYSYKIADKEHKKCQGIKKNIAEKKISHEDNIRCLQTKVVQRRLMSKIQSDHHDLYTEEINKMALSADDGKRVILEEAIGHYSLFEKTII